MTVVIDKSHLDQLIGLSDADGCNCHTLFISKASAIVEIESDEI